MELNVKVGLTLPQGCDREYLGLDPETAWHRTLDIALLADQAGFESLWLYDHFQVDPPPEPAIVFEPMVELAAIAMATERAKLGHLVLAAAYRNAALTAKTISTIDVISGGRAILGIGAGWKEDEWLAYGYGFPEAKVRLDILEDTLEVITRMFQPGPTTYQGKHAHVLSAIHEPKGLQEPRIPIVVGGNGPNRTWRLAARYADELNLDALTPQRLASAIPVIRDRCHEIDRDPETLRLSVHIWGEAGDVPPGEGRQRRFAEYASLGVHRIIVQGFQGVSDPSALEQLFEDCRSAGLLS
ncbi:MAG TPA: TIGR03560 family F420-dependent LLM class oxidoreductase [Acidimicrobiia bacterium]|nr:TIGR03560 family F420-dependent LLM class oxidoreductase [Acidimicrobiia bacterium]